MNTGFRARQSAGTARKNRDKDGSYHVRTTHHMVGAGATWGMFWGFLLGLLFSSRCSAWP